MKERIRQILLDIDSEIDEIDFYGYDIISISLSMAHRLRVILNDLREELQNYVFSTKEDEILFFKAQNRKYLGGCCIFIKYTV